MAIGTQRPLWKTPVKVNTMNRLTFAELFYTGTSFPIDVIALFTHSNPSLFSFSLEDSMKDMYSSSSCLDSFLRYMYKMPGRCPRIDVGPDQCRTAPCSSRPTVGPVFESS